MNSFNVYGQTEKKIGGNTPVWLGTVKPIPRGAKTTLYPNRVIRAGYACTYDAATGTVGVVDAVSNFESANLNGFVYNDCISPGNSEPVDATVAIVMHHPEGLMIERVYPDITEEQIQALQAKVPGVLLVRG